MVVGLLLALTAVGTFAAPARATGGTIAWTSTPAGGKTAIKNVLLDWNGTYNPATGSSATAADVLDGLTMTEEAAAVLPSFGAAASVIGAAPFGVYMGWKLGSVFRKMLYSGPTAAGNGAVTGMTLNPLNAGVYGNATAGFYWQGTQAGVGSDPIYCFSTVSCSVGFYLSATRTAAYQSMPGHDSACCSRDYGVRFVGPTELEANLHTAASTAGEYAGFANKVDNGSWSPPSSITDSTAQAALDANCMLTTSTCTPNAKQTAAMQVLQQAASTGHVPDCVGLSPSACTSAYSSVGFTGTVSSTTAASTDADLSLPAGAVISQDLAGGTTANWSTDLHVTINPDPLPTYVLPDCAAYEVADCEALIAGAAAAAGSPAPAYTVQTADAGSEDYGMLPGAILSMSPAAGANGAHAALTLVANPDPMHGFSFGGKYGGGGNSTTSADPPECEFDDYAFDNEGENTVSWDTLRNADPEKYDQACEDAWQTLRNMGVVTPDGGIAEEWITSSDVVIPGVYLENESVVNALTTGGRTLSQWGKYGIRFNSSNGPAELHFYRMNNSSEVYLGQDFHVVFKVGF